MHLSTRFFAHFTVINRLGYEEYEGQTTMHIFGKTMTLFLDIAMA